MWTDALWSFLVAFKESGASDAAEPWHFAPHQKDLLKVLLNKQEDITILLPDRAEEASKFGGKRGDLYAFRQEFQVGPAKT